MLLDEAGALEFVVVADDNNDGDADDEDEDEDADDEDADGDGDEDEDEGDEDGCVWLIFCILSDIRSLVLVSAEDTVSNRRNLPC